MRGLTTGGRRWLALGLLCSVGLASPAAAIYLDEAQNISFRARVYSQASIRIEDSSTDTVPTTKRGQLVQHRNFYNPELDARLTSYTTWMKDSPLSWLAPDDLSFRFAAWGFYDGMYDYGARQFNRSQRLVNSSYPDTRDRSHAFFLEGPSYNPDGKTINGIYPGHEVLNPRDIFATQRRINELYLNYTKGPLFFRIGRQAISWGEADTIALLDQNNPFDVTLGAPGIFEDLDEARIPLWTVRASLNLFDTLGPLSSGFVEAYWVPGDIDTNTGWFPVLTASPYVPRGQDPQLQLPSLIPVQFVLLDKVPKKSFENSRWGVRLQTVINRFFTVSGWYYTHFPNAPVPLALGTEPSIGANVFTTATIHELTSVIGLSNTFFFEPLDAIIRMEAEYFDNEPSFVPEINMGIPKCRVNAQPGDPLPRCNELAVVTGCNRNPVTGQSECSVPKADYLRWELGFDRNFFFRALNPTNSFLLILATVGSWNLDETGLQDFRMAGQRKPGAQGTSAFDFVQQKKVEGFAQMQLQTDYLHGRLSPSLLYIQNLRGTYVVKPTLKFRWTDWLLFQLDLILIGGEYQQTGFFRDREQISLRMTYQLN